MFYAAIGLLAAAVHIIINLDILLKRDAVPGRTSYRDYRRFLFALLVFFLLDAAWGVLYEKRLTALAYADTVFYFAAMALSVLFWTHYVVSYLERNDVYSRILNRIGWLIFDFAILALLVNAFYPILFSFDEGGVYSAGIARHLVLLIQILMFLATALYSLIVMTQNTGAVRTRFLAIGIVGLAMGCAFAAQLFFPLLPLYSIGALLGGCLLHTFVLEGERAEYRQKLEEALRREQEQESELGSARKLAYTDPLTGVKSGHAYQEAETRFDVRIGAGTVKEFAVAVFDLNGLKHINDTMGHKVGDLYIGTASRLICDVFKHSPVFRIGGDEFAAILEGQDYADRAHLIEVFNAQVEENLRTGSAVVAMGLSEFSAAEDSSFRRVFNRADEAMYERKQQLKEMSATIRP